MFAIRLVTHKPNSATPPPYLQIVLVCVLRVFTEELLPVQLVEPLRVQPQGVQLLELVVLARGGAGAKVEAVDNVRHVHPGLEGGGGSSGSGSSVGGGSDGSGSSGRLLCGAGLCEQTGCREGSQLLQSQLLRQLLLVTGSSWCGSDHVLDCLCWQSVLPSDQCGLLNAQLLAACC